MDTAASLRQEKDAQEQLAIRILGKERYGSSTCQAHPLELVEHFIQEQADRIIALEANISAAAEAAVSDDFEERLSAACITCEVPDSIYEELCVELKRIARQGSIEPEYCHKCGFPMSVNPHPDAGKPAHYLNVGCPTECIPCTVLGRHQWAERAQKAESQLSELRKQLAAAPNAVSFMQWWTSYGVDNRNDMLRQACDDREALLGLVRTAYNAGLTAAPLPATARAQLDELVTRKIEEVDAPGLEPVYAAAPDSVQASVEENVFAFLQRKYVQTADERQKAMGLAYMTAETHELARELSRLFPVAPVQFAWGEPYGGATSLIQKERYPDEYEGYNIVLYAADNVTPLP